MSGENDVSFSSSVQSNNILVPLYIYPSPGAWDPLFKAIQNFHSVTFIIILNPNNGPGSCDYKKQGDHNNTAVSLPDNNYIREILKLNSYANVKTVGYVSTRWAHREPHLAKSDVDIYSNWSKYPSPAPGLGVKGIFLDETVTQYSDSGELYLKELTIFIRSEDNFGPDALV
ncbi:Spherulin-4 [Erysiphe necator]|nr:Spherulin-4 [Erysiphe necator]